MTRRTTIGRALPARLVAVATLLAALAMLWLSAEVHAAEVGYLVPPAQIKRKGTEVWQTLKLGDQVNEGDTLRTGMGARVEIRLKDLRVFRIGQATEVEMTGLQDDRGLRAKFGLILGQFWGSLVKPLARATGEKFEVQTASATIGIKGTSFGVVFDKATGGVDVSVLTGEIVAVPPGKEIGPPTEVPGPREIAPPQEVSRDQWEVIVTRDQRLIIRPGEAPRTVPLTAEDKQDPWVAFNIERDRLLQ
ncbi:MAG: FecR domain-containing protein [Candidatus Lambdaproteobacteria bacterium]|nr:FecR domain-containing protein [Candidatus Lambdaproteobacteria bacterium]